MRKLRPREINDLPVVTIKRWQKWDRNPGLLAPSVQPSEFFQHAEVWRAGRAGGPRTCEKQRLMTTAQAPNQAWSVSSCHFLEQ